MSIPTHSRVSQDALSKRALTLAHFFSRSSINNILYQREIYPPETFRRVSKYGLAMFVTTDEGLGGYLQQVLTQLHGAELLPAA